MRTTNDLWPASMRSSAPATWCHEGFSMSGSLSTDKRNDFALRLTAAAFPITPCMPRCRSQGVDRARCDTLRVHPPPIGFGLVSGRQRHRMLTAEHQLTAAKLWTGRDKQLRPDLATTSTN